MTIPWVKKTTVGGKTTSLEILLVSFYKGKVPVFSPHTLRELPAVISAEMNFRAAAELWFPGAITLKTTDRQLLAKFKDFAKACECDESVTM